MYICALHVYVLNLRWSQLLLIATSLPCKALHTPPKVPATVSTPQSDKRVL